MLLNCNNLTVHMYLAESNILDERSKCSLVEDE